MAVLVIKNPGGSDFFIEDVGVNIPALSEDSWTTFVDAAMIRDLGGSTDARNAVLAGTLVVNDGSSDLSATAGEEYLETRWVAAGFDEGPKDVTGSMLLQYGSSAGVPGNGTRQLQAAGDALVGIRMIRAARISGGSIQVDQTSSNSYTMDIEVNGVIEATVALASGNLGNEDGALDVALAAGDLVTVFMRRTAGGGASAFGDMVGTVEVTGA